MKVCSKCNTEKPFVEFYSSKGYKDGYRSICINCIKKYQEKNKDKKSQYLKKYKQEKKDILKLKNKEYREKNKQKIQEWRNNNKSYFAQYRDKNKDKIKKYFQDNKKKVNETNLMYQRKRTKIDPVFKFKRTVRSLINGSFKRGKNQFRKEAKTEEILGCSISYFKEYIFSKFENGMTFENYGEWHLDHIKPLSTAKSKEDILKLNYYTNFQPLWAKDNMKKGSKFNSA